jgi:hypothetical protein
VRDADIRAALHRDELAHYLGEPDTLVLDELGICQGEYRIDVAVVNGALHGWEIKSERDTLQRLPAQAAAYSRVFDTVSIVCGQSHAAGVREMVPDWWGVSVAHDVGGGVVLERQREAHANPEVDVRSVVELLWRDEALTLLREHGGGRKLYRYSRTQMWDMLVERIPADQLRAIIRATLKGRENWRKNLTTP